MQPREKFQMRGVESLSNQELLAIMLSKGIKGYNFSTVAKQVEGKILGSVSQGLDIYEQMISVKGVGKVKAMQILAGIELGARIYSLHKEKGGRIYNSKEAWNILKYIGRYKQEHVVGLFLNARYELLKKQTVAIGSLDRISIKPRDIIIPALSLNCAYILLAHNHPSGDHTPSVEDISFTKNLKESCDIVGLQLLDHLVITQEGWSRVEI